MSKLYNREYDQVLIYIGKLIYNIRFKQIDPKPGDFGPGFLSSQNELKLVTRL